MRNGILFGVKVFNPYAPTKQKYNMLNIEYFICYITNFTFVFWFQLYVIIITEIYVKKNIKLYRNKAQLLHENNNQYCVNFVGKINKRQPGMLELLQFSTL